MDNAVELRPVSVGDAVTVFCPAINSDPGWEVKGTALAVAPFSVLIAYAIPDTQEKREDWFRTRTATRHGDTNDNAFHYRSEN